MYADDLNYEFVMGHAARGDFAFLLGSVRGRSRNRLPLTTAAKLLTEGGQQVVTVSQDAPRPLRRIPARCARSSNRSSADSSPAISPQARSRWSSSCRSRELRSAALICFEDTLGDLTRRFVVRGAQLIVNITNDGWFLHTAGAEQHLNNAIFRAIENRRPLVRCANTGITCSIDRAGRIDRTGRTAIMDSAICPWLSPHVRSPSPQSRR
jgi:apolipoprotein N-acyltransferase